MSDLLALVDFDAATLAENFHERALVKFMRAENQLIVSKLVLAPSIVAPEPDLVHVLALQLVQVL